MKKTKIICTMGPTTDSQELLEQMIVAGMDVARFNFSHGSHEDMRRRMALVRQAAKAVGKPVALLADSKGPEIRLGTFAGGSAVLETGKEFRLTTREIEGNAQVASVNYAGLTDDVQWGDQILLDDGKQVLIVDDVSGDEIITKVVHGGVISSRKRVAVPGVDLALPFVSEQDLADLHFIAQEGFDYIAASFVRRAEDVQEIRKVLESLGSDIHIIAKIENQSGVDNIESILASADGVMVARGDLGVEIPAEEVPLVQKQIIRKANAVGKPVITATQMLESMINSYRATRAEASDVANSILDGTDAIMLSGETANGKYPLEAVRTMAKIAISTESSLDYDKIFLHKGLTELTTMTDAISHAAVQVSNELDANAIINITESGNTSKLVAKYRPQALVIGVTRRQEVVRRMQLYWGVDPLYVPFSNDTDRTVRASLKAARRAGKLREGQLAVITAGAPVGKIGSTNLIFVFRMGEIILRGTGVGLKSTKGKVVLVRTSADLVRLTSDSIMVVAGLENEMGAAASKCAGIISEEGGFTCGAAVVGINCGLPVIVGAAGALAKLTEGQEVTVDASSGHVYSGFISMRSTRGEG